MTGWRVGGANVGMVRDEWDWRGQVRTWAWLGIGGHGYGNKWLVSVAREYAGSWAGGGTGPCLMLPLQVGQEPDIQPGGLGARQQPVCAPWHVQLGSVSAQLR